MCVIYKYELKCLEMYNNIRMAWCGNLEVYMKVQLVSVICGMNLQLCVTVGTYNVDKVNVSSLINSLPWS